MFLTVGGDHLFEWRSSLHHQPLVTVLFSVHPGFDFPSPRILITNSTSHACPSIIVLWWDIPTEPPFTVLEYLYCQGHSSLDAPSELNPPQRIPSPLFVALLVPQAEG